MPLSLAQIDALIPDSGNNTAADVRAIAAALYDWIPLTEKYKRGRLPGETAHAADDFFTAYSGYTEYDSTGTVTWTAGNGGLSARATGFGNGNGTAFTVKAIPAALPITIETLFTAFPSSTGVNAAEAFGFTSGTTGTAGWVGFGTYTSTYLARVGGTTASSTSAGSFGLTTTPPFSIGTPIFLRVVAKANGNYTCLASIDSVEWRQLWTGAGSVAATSMTHMGFFMAWPGGSGEIQHANFAYLRVYEADLS
jgi:hypothetical protein